VYDYITLKEIHKI